MSSKPLKFGILVPSSNTSLEPLTTSILSGLSPPVTVHFSRFRVTQISLSANALDQFDQAVIVEAAKLLADAGVDAIGWSGTSGGWLGFDVDRDLCERIKGATGVEYCTTSVLGLNAALDEIKLLRQHASSRPSAFALVTPYLQDVQEKVIATYEEAGYAVSAESHLGKTVNVEFAAVDEQTLDGQVDSVLAGLQRDNDGGGGSLAVSTFCTNLRAAQRAATWEAKYDGLIVLDTVATVVWHMLKLVGRDTREVQGWGRMFEL